MNPRDVPITLSSGNTTLGAGISQPNVGRLQPTQSVPMWIDEIRIAMTNVTDATTPISGVAGGQAVMINLLLGRHALTNDFIPVWLLGQNRQSLLGFGSLYTYVSWKLPRPLYVPEGMALMPQLKIDDVTGINVGPVDVSYVGRLTEDPLPKRQAIPYVTTFMVTSQTPGYYQSSEKQLGNPFEVPLHIQKFVGRIIKQRDVNLAWTESGPADLLDVDFWLMRGVGNWRLTRHNRAGVDVGGNAEGNWSDVFDQETRSLDITGLTLGPRDWISTVLDFHASTSTVQNGGVTHAYFPSLSMIGYREESVL